MSETDTKYSSFHRNVQKRLLVEQVVPETDKKICEFYSAPFQTEVEAGRRKIETRGGLNFIIGSFLETTTSKRSCRSWKKIVKSLDDGKVQICLFFVCIGETSKHDPKPQIRIQNVKA